ncbi:MAG: ACT domain-containing protein [Candidatus Nezhaarchaeota archaeon]|nr:ACT domain-containing protein [Candidatus Nezhaarchaeota archaeon]
MRLELTVALQDKPGQLVKALGVIAELGCNVISVVHERSRAVEEVVPVDLVIELPREVSAAEVKKKLEEKGVAVVRLQETVELARLVVIASRLANPLSLITPLQGVKIAGVEGEVGDRGDATIKMTIEGPVSELKRAVKELEHLVEGLGGVLITSEGID